MLRWVVLKILRIIEKHCGKQFNGCERCELYDFCGTYFKKVPAMWYVKDLEKGLK